MDFTYYIVDIFKNKKISNIALSYISTKKYKNDLYEIIRDGAVIYFNHKNENYYNKSTDISIGYGQQYIARFCYYKGRSSLNYNIIFKCALESRDVQLMIGLEPYAKEEKYYLGLYDNINNFDFYQFIMIRRYELPEYGCDISNNKYYIHDIDLLLKYKKLLRMCNGEYYYTHKNYKYIIERIIRYGSYEVLQYVSTLNDLPKDNSLMCNAIYNGNIKFILYLKNIGYKFCNICMSYAVSAGNVVLIEMLEMEGIKLTPQYYYNIFERDNLPLFHYFQKRNINITTIYCNVIESKCCSYIMENPNKYNNIKFSDSHIVDALLSGNLNALIIAFRFKNKNKKNIRSTYTQIHSDENGDIFKLLKYNKIGYDQSVLYNAIYRFDLLTVKILLSIGYKLNKAYMFIYIDNPFQTEMFYYLYSKGVDINIIPKYVNPFILPTL
jgi:hypothetical protein